MTGLDGKVVKINEEQDSIMHSLSNTLFGNQDSYWRGAVGSPYSSLQPLSSMASNLPNTYSPYDQYSSHHAVTSRFVLNDVELG